MKKRLQKRSILMIFLATVLALLTGLAVLFASPAFADSASKQTNAKGAVATIHLGKASVSDPANDVYYFSNFANGWGEAIEYAKEAYTTDNNAYVRVILEANWAPNGGSFGSTDNFDKGRILSPENTNIVIDLNGYEIDRKLAEGTADGQVIIVKGNLTIEDSSNGGGKITGGYNKSDSNAIGGGVYVNGGTLNLKGGSIEGNKAEGTNVYGLGVAVYGGTFNLNGGRISNNEATATTSYGGGVCVYTNGQFNMYDGIIDDHSAVYGGGVASYNVSGTAINIENGTIYRNTATYGGGICVYHDNSNEVVADLKGGDIFNNSSSNYGGGVYVYAKQGTATLNLEGGSIYSNNVTATAGDAIGGGVALKAESGATLTAKMTAGNISYNSVNGSSQKLGGGIYVANSTTFEMSGGSVIGNVGGGVYVDTSATISLSDTPVITENTDGSEVAKNLQIPSGNSLKIAGKLNDGALVGVSVANSSATFTTGYGKNNGDFISLDGKNPNQETELTNGAWAYVNASKYFAADAKNNYVVVTKNGELGITDKAIKLKVAYANETKEIDLNDKNNTWNYVVSTYGDSDCPKSVTPVLDTTESEAVTIDGNAKVNTIEAGSDSGVKAVFLVIIKQKELDTDDVEITLDAYDFTYAQGQARQPGVASVSIKGGDALNASNDYSVGYENNINAGEKATVVITFKGNYTGTAYKYFTIKTSTDSSKTMSVVWEVNNGSGWVSYDNTKFTYNGNNQGDKIQAKLSVAGEAAQTVSVDSKDLGLYLQFNLDGENVDFVEAGTYSVTIVGLTNYPVNEADKTLSGVVMQSAELVVPENDLGSFTDKNNNPLWKLKIGSDNGDYDLLKGATYIVDKNGSEQVETDNDGYFARYRGVELSIVLNGDYFLTGYNTYLSELLKLADEVKYVHESNTGDLIGARGVVTVVNTTVQIKISGNYSLTGYDNNVIEVVLQWSIVTIGNNLRTEDGKEDFINNYDGWHYGNANELDGIMYRPEHGDAVIYSYYLVAADKSEELVGQFALKYSDSTLDARISYYEVSDGEIIESRPINDQSYLYNFIYALQAGSYKLVVTIPELEQSTESHTHWWNGEVANDNGVKYYELNYTFTFEVKAYELAVIEDGEDAWDPNIDIEISDTLVEYTGDSGNVAKPVIKLFQKVLVEGEDYILSTSSVGVGSADLTILFIGSVKGEITIQNAFDIIKGRNGWRNVPSIMHWTYNNFVKEVNLINADPYLLDDPDGLWFSIAYDGFGENLISGLEHFTVENGCVSDEVAAILKALPAESYFLIGHVEGSYNYYELEPQIIPFTVFTATNSWEITPSVNSWTEGQYDESEEHVFVAPVFGNAHVVIKDAKGNVYYDNEQNINRLAEAKAGRYTLTAEVAGSENYSGLDIYTVMFDIFEKPGLPWWSALLITVGALCLAALVIFILWKKGVFQIVTEKIVVAIRTRASVEATIASVRASMKMEEGRKSVEDAKRRERIEKMRQKAEEQRAMSPEERAAMLEAKAQADAARAEKLRARSEASLAKAEKMRKEEAQHAKATPESEAAVSDTPDTPTEK